MHPANRQHWPDVTGASARLADPDENRSGRIRALQPGHSGETIRPEMVSWHPPRRLSCMMAKTIGDHKITTRRQAVGRSRRKKNEEGPRSMFNATGRSRVSKSLARYISIRCLILQVLKPGPGSYDANRAVFIVAEPSITASRPGPGANPHRPFSGVC